jgi:hypothetical protein
MGMMWISRAPSRNSVMRWFFNSSLVLLILMLAFSTANAVEIGQIYHEINPDKTAVDNRRDYWKDIVGQQVTWTGKLHEVLGGFRDVYKVFVLVGHPEVGKYNVILTVEDQPLVHDLKKGSTVRFTGTLHKYKWSKPRPVRQRNGTVTFVRQFVIYLEDGHIDSGTGK